MFNYAAHGLIESATKLDLPGGRPHTIGAVLERQLQRDAHKLALVGRSARYSYAELDAEVAKAAGLFFARGIRRYDRIAACLPNDVDIIVAFLACARLGAIWVGVNRPLAAPEKAFILEDSGACLYLTDTAGIAEIDALRGQLPALRSVLCIDADAGAEWRALLDASVADSVPPIFVDPFEPAAIAYTSGTTGRPKGAVHSHHNVLLPGAIKAQERYFGPDCVQGVMLPLTILNLMVLAPMVAFQDGSCCVCMDSVKPEEIARWVREERIGHFASVPTVVQDLLTSERVDATDLATLGHPEIGGAGIAQAFQQLYAERFGRRMTVAYGMTEAPTIVTRTSGECELQEELCGYAVEQVEILIVDEDDHVLPPDSIGQICVAPATSGPYARVYTTMLGYWNRPEATAAALRNSRYHTGDIGFLDTRGQLFIRGRQNDLIIRGGANVYPVEVERVLGAHPAVAAVAVLGIADERLGQRVAAVIELSEAATVVPAGELLQSLQAHCAMQLARYKVPEQIRFVDSLPRNAMNKIIKPQLQRLF
jgi:acyl-CoA synthetase (AMP-forming)/AMP-acid ligase II